MSDFKINKAVSALLGLSFYVFLFIAYNLADYISPENKDFYLQIERGVQTFLVITAAWVTSRLVNIFVWGRVQKRQNKGIPDVVCSASTVVIYVLFLMFVLLRIYDQNYATVITLGGVFGVGLGLGLQGLILDAFAGVLIDLEGKVSIGDWIEIHGHELDKAHGPAKVVNLTWRAVVLENRTGYIVLVPHSVLTRTSIRNYSRPNDGFTEFVEVSLDHDVPVARAKAIIHEALLAIPEIDKYNPAEVWAKGLNEGGVIYEIRFTASSYRYLKRLRHNVIEVTTNMLHERGLRVSETIGVMPFSVDDLEMKEAPETRDAIRKTALFSVLSDENVKILAQKCSRKYVPANSVLCEEGDAGESMFIIIEGVVQVFKKNPINPDEPIHLANLRGGDYFGEMSMLTGKPRTADITTCSRAVLIEITKRDLSDLLRKRKALADEIAQIVTQRQLDTQIKVDREGATQEDFDRMSKDLSNQIKAFFGFSKN
ncbi:MAG: mechanosensitive ion channel family protein [Alphaproteobacteria bacterium]|nr:MAG: mechanosensitive ion channel family protein [Alphaproteobacteria bacterium]